MIKKPKPSSESDSGFFARVWQLLNALATYLSFGLSGWSRKKTRPKRKVIGFDVWNTTALIRAWPVEPLIDVGKSMHIPLDDKLLRQRFIDHCNELPISDPRAFAENVARTFNGTVSEEAVAAIQKIIKVEHDAFAWYRDVVPCFRTLKENGLGVGLLSNTWTFTGPLLTENSGVSEHSCGDHVIGLRHLTTQVHQYIDHVVLSCEEDVRCCKPGIKIFQVFARRFGVECKDCIYVGDNVTTDMYGALEAGMLPILIDRTNSVSVETRQELQKCGIHCVSSLFELLQLLRVLGYLPAKP